MILNIQDMSARYTVKRLTEEDIPCIYTLCRENTGYYEYLKMEPTPENIREVFYELPPGKSLEDLYFLGFYHGKPDTAPLSAILVLVTGYPEGRTAYIGWFMMAKELQGAGIGSQIITDLLQFLKREGFHAVRLGVIEGNKEAEGFWLKNNFLPVRQESWSGSAVIMEMQREL